uniref:Uncharacterized protein n=1 Tax=Physcomitrium patens TaxID=3218 RepID=A0A2K1K8B2_PHYPA|nr:hypothetical protein PHYPA_011912 [Physcomitrium patens]
MIILCIFTSNASKIDTVGDVGITVVCCLGFTCFTRNHFNRGNNYRDLQLRYPTLGTRSSLKDPEVRSGRKGWSCTRLDGQTNRLGTETGCSDIRRAQSASRLLDSYLSQFLANAVWVLHSRFAVRKEYAKF